MLKTLTLAWMVVLSFDHHSHLHETMHEAHASNAGRRFAIVSR